MNNKWAWVGSAVAVVAIAALIVVFWPSGDPLAGVETIAVESIDWREAPQGEIIQGPFLNGLKIILGDKNITIVGNVDEADAVLVIKEIKLDKIEVLINEGGIKGKASATCVLTDLKTDEETILDFYLTIENGTVEAKLVPRKLWQFWK